MELLITNYTFDKTAKTITFNDYTSIAQERIKGIIDITANVVIYNPAKTGYGGTVSGNVLTLAYDTSALANTDKLMALINDDYIPASNDMIETLIDLAQNLEVLGAVRDNVGNLRVSIQNTPNIGTVTTVTTVSTVTTVATLTNQSQIGGFPAQPQVPAINNMVAIFSNINNLN